MFQDLPSYIDYEIEYEDGAVVAERFFFSINRDLDGYWSAGYVHFATEEDGEMAIPELVTNSSETLKEAEARMVAKYNRFRKNHGQRRTNQKA